MVLYGTTCYITLLIRTAYAPTMYKSVVKFPYNRLRLIISLILCNVRIKLWYTYGIY